MAVRILIVFFLLVVIFPAQAEIYKCVVNSKTIFSDQPCADNAEKIEIKVYKPSNDDIEQQQQATQIYKEESRVNELKSLRDKNENLKKKAKQLDQEKQAELQILGKKIYQVSDSAIGTREHGVFKKMAAVAEKYRIKIAQINAEIKQNEIRMSQLFSQAP